MYSGMAIFEANPSVNTHPEQMEGWKEWIIQQEHQI